MTKKFQFNIYGKVITPDNFQTRKKYNKIFLIVNSTINNWAAMTSSENTVYSILYKQGIEKIIYHTLACIRHVGHSAACKYLISKLLI